MSSGLLYKMTAKPGQRRQVADLLLESAKLFDDNPNCLGYIVSEAADDPDVIWVLELWTTVAAHGEAIQSAAVQALVGQAFKAMDGMPEQIELATLGSHGTLGTR